MFIFSLHIIYRVIHCKDRKTADTYRLKRKNTSALDILSAKTILLLIIKKKFFK